MPRVALTILRPPQGAALRYEFPLAPEELSEHIEVDPNRKDARTVLRFTVQLDALDGRTERDETLALLPDLAVFRQLANESRLLLEWGVRVLPVDPIHIVIREQAFAPNLAPVRAEVDLTLALILDPDARDARRSAAARYRALLASWFDRVTHPGEAAPTDPLRGRLRQPDIVTDALGRLFRNR